MNYEEASNWLKETVANRSSNQIHIIYPKYHAGKQLNDWIRVRFERIKIKNNEYFWERKVIT